MIYFAYGSNLDPVQWAARCPGSPLIGVGRLEGYRLHFPRRSPVRQCAVASIEAVGEGAGVGVGGTHRVIRDEAIGGVAVADEAVTGEVIGDEAIKDGAAGSAAAEGAVVWGALYQMSAEDFAALDAREGHYPDRMHDSRYLRRTVRVRRLDRSAVEALTYVAIPSPDPGHPSESYVKHLIDGAVHHGFPEAYVTMLRSIRTMPA
ncbi:MAG: gamma-glutamylcyclotransferase [Bauldia sp.]|nr:gamma-glutamylcyclotransferase [Bauldia sp.]